MTKLQKETEEYLLLELKRAFILAVCESSDDELKQIEIRMSELYQKLIKAPELYEGITGQQLVRPKFCFVD